MFHTNARIRVKNNAKQNESQRFSEKIIKQIQVDILHMQRGFNKIIQTIDNFENSNKRQYLDVQYLTSTQEQLKASLSLIQTPRHCLQTCVRVQGSWMSTYPTEFRKICTRNTLQQATHDITAPIQHSRTIHVDCLQTMSLRVHSPL